MKNFNKPVCKITICVTVKSLKEASCRKHGFSRGNVEKSHTALRGCALKVEGSMLSVVRKFSQPSTLLTQRYARHL